MKELINAAARIAANGATHYLQVNRLTADPSALAACLRSWVKIQLPNALHDAREALDCHMNQVAEATFAASMIQAGIEAAKEASNPPCPREIAQAAA